LYGASAVQNILLNDVPAASYSNGQAFFHRDALHACPAICFIICFMVPKEVRKSWHLSCVCPVENSNKLQVLTGTVAPPGTNSLKKAKNND